MGTLCPFSLSLDVADPKKDAPVPVCCYHTKFGRSRSILNRSGVSRGSQKLLGTLGPAPWVGGRDDNRNMLLPRLS